jgi:hypothetical protein
MPEDHPTPDLLDDAAIDVLLAGRSVAHSAAVPELAPLVTFVQDVRSVVDRPAPQPSAALAEVLASGLSTDKGDLLVTAGSNVNGPAESRAPLHARQVAGLPKWRKRPQMLPTGFLSGLAVKIAAAVTAVLAGVTAAGAAGALPSPAQHVVAGVINSITPFSVPDGDTSAAISTNVPTPAGGVGATVGAGTDADGAANVTGTVSTPGVQTSVGSTQSTGGANVGANAGTTMPSLPNLSNLPGLSNLPALSSLPGVQIPSCVKDIVDVKTGQPKVPLSQVAPQVVSCVQTLLASAHTQLPAGLDQCVSSILATVATATPGSVPNIGSFDFSKCAPVDATACMSSVMSAFGSFLPGFSGGASTHGATATATGGASLPSLSGFDLSSCMPFNLDACLSSIFGMAGNLPGLGLSGVPGLGRGTLPSVGSVDLSSCVPFGAIGNLPGLSQFGSLLPH